MQTTNTNITQEQLDLFKSLFPGDKRIQAVTLNEILLNTAGQTVDWNSLEFPPAKTSGVVAGSSLLSISDCQLKIGYVIFDVILVAVNAVGLRSTVDPATIGTIYQAATPVMARIDIIVAGMAAESASAKVLAYGVFQILKTIWSGGCLGAVIKAFTASLTWYQGILYGVTAVATIVAFMGTDGIAFVAQVFLLLTTFASLAIDSVNAAQACTLPAPTVYPDGTRLSDTSTGGMIYLVLDGALRWIPDSQTYANLYSSFTSGVTSLPNVQTLLIGSPISEGASLVTATPLTDGHVYLLQEDGKRWIINPDVFNNKFAFDVSKIQTIPADQLNAIPTGDPIT